MPITTRMASTATPIRQAVLRRLFGSVANGWAAVVSVLVGQRVACRRVPPSGGLPPLALHAGLAHSAIVDERPAAPTAAAPATCR